nr:unnamed protein product [Callosobruchus analis]
MFRLTKELALTLINSLDEYLVAPTRKSAIDKQTKFLASGSYQEIIGSNHFVGISQSSVSHCIREICSVLNSPNIFNQWVCFPGNIEQLENIRQRFYEKFQFPGIVGIIDCTVAITSPNVNNAEQPERAYVNRKNYHSLNVQLICDSTLKILNVNASFPGSTHDSFIWSQSRVSDALERIYRQNPTDTFFVIGDSGYPTRPRILTPILNPEAEQEERFNERFCSIRCGIERCIGVLKNRFWCLLKHCVLHYSPRVAATIVNACVVLHNMCIIATVLEPQEDDEEGDIDFGNYAQRPASEYQRHNSRVNMDLLAARQLRQNIINNHFFKPWKHDIYKYNDCVYS